jgi:RNA polymerase sigma factor (sigma-70 family)
MMRRHALHAWPRCGIQPTVTTTTRSLDLLLARAAASGDGNAFRDIHHAHAVAIRRLARRVLPADRVDDGVQDALVRVWERLHQYRGDSALSTWVHRVAFTVLWRLRAQTSRDARREVTSANPPDMAVPSSDAVDCLALEQAIGRLSGATRIVFQRVAVEGYSHEDVAAELGIRVATSRSHLRHARVQLRQILEGTR